MDPLDEASTTNGECHQEKFYFCILKKVYVSFALKCLQVFSLSRKSNTFTQFHRANTYCLFLNIFILKLLL